MIRLNGKKASAPKSASLAPSDKFTYTKNYWASQREIDFGGWALLLVSICLIAPWRGSGERALRFSKLWICHRLSAVKKMKRRLIGRAAIVSNGNAVLMHWLQWQLSIWSAGPLLWLNLLFSLCTLVWKYIAQIELYSHLNHGNTHNSRNKDWFLLQQLECFIRWIICS